MELAVLLAIKLSHLFAPERDKRFAPSRAASFRVSLESAEFWVVASVEVGSELGSEQ